METRVTDGKVRDSKSMGFIGVSIMRWRSKLRVYCIQVGKDYGEKLIPGHAVWTFLSKHAAFRISCFRVRPDGVTAYLIVHGVNYTR